jgi:hypothetical protein
VGNVVVSGVIFIPLTVVGTWVTVVLKEPFFFRIVEQPRGPFQKFVDSPYYSESELRGGAVTVFFEVRPLASDALLTTLHPLLENVNGA